MTKYGDIVLSDERGSVKWTCAGPMPAPEQILALDDALRECGQQLEAAGLAGALTVEFGAAKATYELTP